MDIYSRLLKDRIVILGTQVNDVVANTIVAQLLFLQFEDGKADIHMYINSPGGSITAGMAIYDTMQYVTCDVATYCIGQAASMGAILLTAGAPGKRNALPNARIMIHQPLAGMEGTATELAIHAKEVLRIKQRMNEILLKHTGQTLRTDRGRHRPRQLHAAGRGQGLRPDRPHLGEDAGCRRRLTASCSSRMRGRQPPRDDEGRPWQIGRPTLGASRMGFRITRMWMLWAAALRGRVRLARPDGRPRKPAAATGGLDRPAQNAALDRRNRSCRPPTASRVDLKTQLADGTRTAQRRAGQRLGQVEGIELNKVPDRRPRPRRLAGRRAALRRDRADRCRREPRQGARLGRRHGVSTCQSPRPSSASATGNITSQKAEGAVASAASWGAATSSAFPGRRRRSRANLLVHARLKTIDGRQFDTSQSIHIVPPAGSARKPPRPSPRPSALKSRPRPAPPVETSLTLHRHRRSLGGTERRAAIRKPGTPPNELPPPSAGSETPDRVFDLRLRTLDFGPVQCRCPLIASGAVSWPSRPRGFCRTAGKSPRAA